MAAKDSQNGKNSPQERLQEAIRKLDLGDGIEVTMGLQGEDGTDTVIYYFSNKIKGLKRSTKDELGEIEVEYSSVQTDDTDLLHSLLQRVRS